MIPKMVLDLDVVWAPPPHPQTRRSWREPLSTVIAGARWWRNVRVALGPNCLRQQNQLIVKTF